MANTIQLAHSKEADETPSSLVAGEVAINSSNRKIWVGDGTANQVIFQHADYLQLSGGTLTGALAGTTAAFSFAAGNHTTGISVTNTQAGGYGNALTFSSKRSDDSSLNIAARIRTEGASSWNTDASTSSNLKFETVSADTLATRMTVFHDGKVGITGNVGIGVNGDHLSGLHIDAALSGGNGSDHYQLLIEGDFNVHTSGHGMHTAAGIQVNNSTDSGPGFVYSKRGITIDEQTVVNEGSVSQRCINLLLGTIGDYNVPSGNYSIYSASTRASYFAGPVEFNTIGSNLVGAISTLFDLGTASLKWRNLNMSGTATIGSGVSITGSSSFQGAAFSSGITGTTAAFTGALTVGGDISASGNRILNSQTVTDLHRTAEPSLRFDGTDGDVSIADNNALDLVTNGTVVVIFRATNVGSAAVATSWQSIVTKRAAGTNYEVGIEDNGRMFLYNGSAVGYFTFIPTNDVWTHCAVVYSGATASLYINGVFQESISSALGAVNAHSLGIGAIPNSGQTFTGEIKDVRIHNRALDSDEVAASYNGESTPWKYAELTYSGSTYAAGYDLLTYPSTDITGTFESDDPDDAGWTDTGSSTISRVTTTQVSGSYSMYCVGCVGSGNAAIFDIYNDSSKPFKGKAFRWSFWARTSSGTNTLNTEVYGQGGTRGTHSITATWTQFTYEDTFYYDHALTRFYFYTDSASNNFYIDDVELVLTGEVAAYTPQSITSGEWRDTTSNANHGDVSGATMVGFHDLGSIHVTQDGKVGIGTAEPDYSLTVKSTANAVFQLETTGTSKQAYITLTSGGTDWSIKNDDQNFGFEAFVIRDEQAALNRFIIHNNGNIGIGTDSPGGYKLYVNGSGYFASTLNINSQTGINITADCAGNVGYAAQYFSLDNSTSDATGHIRLARTAGTQFLGMEIAADAKHGMRFLTTDGGTLTERLKIDQNGSYTFTGHGNFVGGTFSGAMTVGGTIATGGTTAVSGSTTGLEVGTGTTDEDNSIRVSAYYGGNPMLEFANADSATNSVSKVKFVHTTTNSWYRGDLQLWINNDGDADDAVAADLHCTFFATGSTTFQGNLHAPYWAGNLLPSSDNSYALGNASYRWSSVNAITANFGGTLTVSDQGNVIDMRLGDTRGGTDTNYEIGSYGTGQTNVGQNQYPILSITINNSATDYPQETGISLYNTVASGNTTVGTYSPAIAFTAKEDTGSGVVYNSQYASIVGQQKGENINSDWQGGDLTFWTKPVGPTSDFDLIERLRIGNDGTATFSGNVLAGYSSKVTSGSGWRFIGELTGTGANTWQMGCDNNDSNFSIYEDDGKVVTVKTGGNVGIGTTSPDAPLEIQKVGTAGATTEFLRLDNVIYSGNQLDTATSIDTYHRHQGNAPKHASSISTINETSWAGGVPSDYSASIAFSTRHADSFSEKVRIQSDGSVGIGTSNPGIWKLYVNGITKINGALECDALSPAADNTHALGNTSRRWSSVTAVAVTGVSGTFSGDVSVGDQLAVGATSAATYEKLLVKEGGAVTYSHANNRDGAIVATTGSGAFALDSNWVNNWHKIGGLFVSSEITNNYANYGIVAIAQSNGGKAWGGSFSAEDVHATGTAYGVHIKKVTANTRYGIYDQSGAPWYTSGAVGIGVGAPSQKLEVEGDIRIRDARSLFFKRHGDNYAWRVRNESASDNSTYGFDGANDLVFEVVSDSNTNATPGASSHAVYGSTGNTLVLKETGRIGIGTIDPGTYKLYVNGNTWVQGSLESSGQLKAGTSLAIGSAGSGGYTLPAADGTANYVLKTNGSGTVSWAADSGSGVTHTGEVTGTTSLTIADNKVDEANLKVSNTPTDGYVLVARPAESGGLTWEERAHPVAIYLRSVMWKHVQSQVAYSGDVATLTHSLDTEYVTVSFHDVVGSQSNAGAGGLVEIDYLVEVVVVDSNNIKFEFTGNTQPTYGDEFKVTVIGNN